MRIALLLGLLAVLVGGRSRVARADEPVPERAWVRPAAVRVYQSLLGRHPKLVRSPTADEPVLLSAEEVLVIAVSRGDQVRVEADHEIVTGLGSGYGEVPDVVTWQGNGKQREFEIPTFSAARFLVVKGRGNSATAVNVSIAAGLEDPLAWHRADQQVRDWLSHPDDAPPPLPAALATARPVLRWLVAARQALPRSSPSDARQRWLQARWLEETFQMRPLYRPYFGPRRFRISGGSIAKGQQTPSRPGTQIEQRELRGGDELWIEGSDIDIVSLVVSAAADRDTDFDVYSGSELMSRSKVTVPARGRRAGWLGARLVRVVPPVGGRVTVRMTAGRALVTVRAYSQLGGVLDRGDSHDRRALLGSHESVARDVVHALLNADRDRSRATRLGLGRSLADLPASEPAARALLVHETMRHDRGGPPPVSHIEALWSLTGRLPPTVRLPLRLSALAQLEVVTTRVWDATLPAPDAAERKQAPGLDHEQGSIAALRAILAPERDGLGPTEALSAERWAAASHLPHAIDWAATAWRREGPYKLLLPVAAPVQEKLVQVVPERDENECGARGPRGQRWLSLERTQELSMKYLGGTHTRFEVRGAPDAEDADALIALDDQRFSVHAGARLTSVLAVAPGTHRFRQLRGNALLARFASDARYPCSSLLEVERWAVVDRQAAFELPSGHGRTELALTVDPDSFQPPAELTLRSNGRVQRATFSGPASGTAQFWVEPAVRRVVIESNQPLLVRARVRQRRSGRPTPEASPPAAVPHTQAEWLALLRSATRQLRGAETNDARDRLRAERAEALEALGYERWASVERTRMTRGTGQTTAAPPYGAFRLAAGAPAIVARGPLPAVPPLARPTPEGWFARLLDAEQSGEDSASLLAVLQSRSLGLGDVDALLLAELAETEGQLATATEAWLGIWREHQAVAALVEAARLTTDRAARTLDLAATFDAYSLALEAREAGGDVGALLGRMGNSMRWLSIGAERMSGTRWVEQRRSTSADEPLSAQVRRSLTDAPDGAVLLGAEPAGFGTSSFGSSTVQVEALCHSLTAGDENCSVDLKVDGQRLPCRPVDAAARQIFERRRLDPTVSRPIRCQVELPPAAERLTVRLAAAGRAAVGWAVARGVLPEGLGPSKFVSRWVEGDAERPVEAWLVGPTVLRLAARGDDPSSEGLALTLQHEDPAVPPIMRELPLSSDVDPNASSLGSGQPLTREERYDIIVPRAGSYHLTLTPRRGRVLMKLRMSEVVAPPRALGAPSVPPSTGVWRLLAGQAPRLSPVGVDPVPGPLTLGTWLAFRSRDVTEGDQELAEGYAELGVGLRRALVDDLVWSAVQIFDRERVGPSSQGALGGVWLTSRGGFPGAYARGELATQVLGEERALGALGVFGVLYPWTLRHDLKLVPVAQLVVRRADPAGKDHDDVDPQVYSNYAATRPHSVDWIARLDHRPYVDTLLGTSLRVRMAPKFEGVDRVDLAAQAQVLAGSGWAPWVSLETLASHRPVSPQRREAFTRFVATPAVTFWTWMDASQRLSLAGLLSYFVDVPRDAGRDSELSGQIQLSYDYTFLRGLNDFPLTDRPFRARLEEGLDTRRRAGPKTHPYWGGFGVVNQAQLAASLAHRLTSLAGGLAGRIRGELLTAIAQRVVVLTDSQTDSDASIVMALLRVAAENISEIEHVTQRRVALQRSLRSATNPAETRAQLRVQIEALESDGVELARDLAAVNRWLDIEALDDRLAALASEAVDHVDMAYLVATRLLETRNEPVVGLAQRVVVDTALEHAKSTSFEVIGVGALDLVRALLELAPAHGSFLLLGATHLRALNGLVADTGRSIWVNVAALRLLCRSAPTSAVGQIIEDELSGRERKDGMFLRHAALQHAAQSGLHMRERLRLLSLAMDDPSEHVRQGLAVALAKTQHRGSVSLLRKLVLQDPSARVRAYALLRFFDLVRLEPSCAEPLHATAVELLEAHFDGNGSDLVVRALCRELRSLCQVAPPWFDPEHFVLALDKLMQKLDLSLELAAELGGVLVALEVHADPVLNEVRRRLREVLGELLLGESAEVELPRETSREHIEKALSVATRGDHAVSLKRSAPGRYRVTRGERRAFRLWRFWFELMTPGPDKRQAHHHSAARAPDGETVAVPRGMAEVTKTRVPGERRVHSQINGWGEFLPLVDDFIFACGLNRRERHVVCSFGTITIVAPSGFWSRLWARICLNLRFTRSAALRERSLEAEDADTRRRFVDAMQKLGFALRFEHEGGRVNRTLYSRASPSVKAYYSVSAGLLMPVWMDRIFRESALATNNSVWHLAVILWVVSSVMVIRAAWIRRRIDQQRLRFRLCIGGWGSRGKSGTERLKAALFHALRFDVVVKTTGCEAMFIHARRDMPARELFVYRAYDRATIWEQEKILDFAHRLNAEVFLWECMALRPEFVRVLQEEWMRDDITTLTNAYPDHEDIMGPSGEEVAQVIASFSGARGVVFTSETQMLPVLKNAAEAKGSRVVAISDLDAELLPRDLLARFPYAEHPNNIALVLAVAEHLGVSRDWALAKMADHVVPDLGVLKTYPTADYRARKLTFSNGMSANERAGFMSNWIRLGLNELLPEGRPETMIVAVVNNRADRVPRSRVFAELLTWDAVPERLVLIGTNLITLERLLKEGAERYISDQSLAGAGGHAARIDAVFRHFKLAPSWPVAKARLSLALQSAGHSDEDVTSELPDAEPRPEALKEQVRQLLGRSKPPSDAPAQQAEGHSVERRRDLEAHCEFLVHEYERASGLRASLIELLEAGKVSEAEQELKVELTELFMRRVTIVHDSHAKGDQVIHQVAMVVPPGHHAHILGCQNIKGTGLDFAYRWVSLGQVAQLVDRLESERGGRSENLAALTTYSDYGLIECGYTLQRVQPLMDDADWVQEREALGILVGSLRDTLTAKQRGLVGGSKRSPFAKVLGLVEPWVDHLDSIRRARRARAIMNDLFARRVGQANAARLLREVVARGKGGWLYEDFRRRRS